MTLAASCSSFDSISFQLHWVTQAQFAGYYAAREMRYYTDECLEVKIIAGGPDVVALDELTSGRVNLTSMFFSSMLQVRDQGHDVRGIFQHFRRTSMNQVSLKSSNLKTPADYKGKRVGHWDGLDAQLIATMAKYNITPADVDWIKSSYSPLGLVQTPSNLDATSAMSYNELGQLLETFKSPGKLYQKDDFDIVDFNQEETAMLEDGIGVMGSWFDVTANKNIALRFVKASLKGWIYCRDNPLDCVNFLYDKGYHQQYQMNEINKLIWPAPGGIGMMPKDVYKSTVNIAKTYGIISTDASPDSYTDEIAFAALESLKIEEPNLDVEGLDFVGQDNQFCLRADGSTIFLCGVVDPSYIIISGPLGVSFMTLSIILIFIALVCLVATFLFRKSRIMRAAAPVFCYPSLVGLIMGLVSVTVWLGPPTAATCELRHWLLPIGADLLFLPIYVKSFMIYRIYTAKLKRRSGITPFVAAMFALLIFDVIIQTVWSAVDPLVPTSTRYASGNLFTACISQTPNVWYGLTIGYQVFQTIVGLTILFLCRRLPTEFREIMPATLTTVIYGIILVVWSAVLLALTLEPTTAYPFVSMGVIIVTGSALGLIHVYKMVLMIIYPNLAKDPASEKLESEIEGKRVEIYEQQELVRSSERTLKEEKDKLTLLTNQLEDLETINADKNKP